METIVDITNLRLRVFTEKHEPIHFQFESVEVIGEDSINIDKAWSNFIETIKSLAINQLKHAL